MNGENSSHQPVPILTQLGRSGQHRDKRGGHMACDIFCKETCFRPHDRFRKYSATVGKQYVFCTTDGCIQRGKPTTSGIGFRLIKLFLLPTALVLRNAFSRAMQVFLFQSRYIIASSAIIRNFKLKLIL